uniref:Uncharacterized protein n=1 Tax=Oryza meridionalis TaxID=40149 RepID=A0A0E0CG50_9ORYZ
MGGAAGDRSGDGRGGLRERSGARVPAGGRRGAARVCVHGRRPARKERRAGGDEVIAAGGLPAPSLASSGAVFATDLLRSAVTTAAGLDGIQYCSEHPYRPGAAAATVAGGGICAFCLQEKLGRLVSSSKSSPFFPLGGHPPPSAPSSFRRTAAVAEPPAS